MSLHPLGHEKEKARISSRRQALSVGRRLGRLAALAGMRHIAEIRQAARDNGEGMAPRWFPVFARAFVRAALVASFRLSENAREVVSGRHTAKLRDFAYRIADE